MLQVNVKLWKNSLLLLATLMVLSVRVYGQIVPIKHPVLDHKIDQKKTAVYEKAVRDIMSLGEEDMLSLVPGMTYAARCECPVCYKGIAGLNVFEWDVQNPNKMTCKYCGTVFPNAAYPEDHILSGVNSLGEEIVYNYHFNTSSSIGVRHFLTAHLWMLRRDWLVRKCVDLGKAYQVTENEEYARRVVLVLDKAAQVYPHYPAMHNKQVRSFKFCESQQPPWPWDSGRWGHYHNEISYYLVEAYDLVYDSKSYDEISEAQGYDVRKRLENRFFRNAVSAVKTQSPILHNATGTGYNVTNTAMLGWVMGEPGYVHWAIRQLMEIINTKFFFDGTWHEAPSYHYQIIGGLKSAFFVIRGYSDPPGYVDVVDGTRFDAFAIEKDVPSLARYTNAPSVLDFPNGYSSPIHDTHPNEKRSQPRNVTISTIAPGYGHASLGRGLDENQLQAQLHFSGNYGHAHYDNLNLTLWAKGHEMLPDIGYTKSKMRYWTTCTVGHNTVVVDQKDQVGQSSDGNLLWFFPESSGVSVVEADGKRGYQSISGLDTYRRMLIMVPVSLEDAYVVDLFRVRGGSVHDWALHGDADEDMNASCNLKFSGSRDTMLDAREEWQEPTTATASFNPYGMLRDINSANTDSNFHVDFSYIGDPEKGVRIHVPAYLTGDTSMEVFLGRSPSVRRMGYDLTAEDYKAYDFWMPQLLLRRQNDNSSSLASLFAVVEEPYIGHRFIDSVERLTLNPSDENAVALRIVHGNTVDTIISTLDEPPFPERNTPDGTTIKGRLGIVRQVAGKPTAAWLFEGEKLEQDGLVLNSEEGCFSGRILAALRKEDGAKHDAFVTDVELPNGKKLNGVWMIVKHSGDFTHGYEIDRVEKRDGKRVIVLTMDHGLRITGGNTEEVFFPQRKFTGQNEFVIPLSVTFKKL